MKGHVQCWGMRVGGKGRWMKSYEFPIGFRYMNLRRPSRNEKTRSGFHGKKEGRFNVRIWGQVPYRLLTARLKNEQSR